MGLTKVLYEVALALTEPVLRYVVGSLICYLKNVASEMVLVFGWVVGPGDVDGLTFVWVEFHTLLIFP